MKNAEIKENIYLPKKLICGYRLRYSNSDYYIAQNAKEDGRDTYKVGFVAYYDEKGKFRHETSFNSWIDKDVPTEEFDNKPTCGFKIYKQANRFSWNRFSSYRDVTLEIKDPRGWVFEISHNNLAWIIDNCNIYKGDIEGDFVYGWDGKDRVLIPCVSDTYKELVEYSKKLNEKQFIQPKNLQPFHIYKSRQGESLLYIGRFDEYEHRREERCNERRLVHMMEKDGWTNIGHEKEYLYGICYKRGKSYHFMKCTNDTKNANFTWNDKGLSLYWDNSLKNPKDKFIEDVDYIDDVKLQNEIKEYLFSHKECLHSIDYSNSYKYYITADDLIAYRDIERNANNMWMWRIDSYSDIYDDGCGGYKVKCGWKREVDNSDEWYFDMEVKKGWWSKKDERIDVHEFVKKYKPYLIYHKYDDNDIKFTNDTIQVFLNIVSKNITDNKH